MTHEAERAAVQASLALDGDRGTYRARSRCICGCGKHGVQKHHAVYEQEIKRRGGKVDDPRNLVPIWHACHGAHHGRAQALQLRVLPASVFEFAEELMGAGAAYEYLRRRYAGEDERLAALLERSDV